MPKHSVSFLKNLNFYTIINCQRCGAHFGPTEYSNPLMFSNHARHTCYTCGRVICGTYCAERDPEHTPWFHSRYYCRAHDVDDLHLGCSCRQTGKVPTKLAYWGNGPYAKVPVPRRVGGMCALCCCQVNVGTVDGEPLYYTSCGHKFHEPCLAKWQSIYLPSCPIPECHANLL